MRSPESLDGHVRARYESHPYSVMTPASEYPRRGTIGRLSDEVLLNIFHYYLDATPRSWPRLVHTCRRWRRIALASQQALHLRLFCTHGTAVLKFLDLWPALPIVMEYGGFPALDPPAPKDEDNIMALVLKQSARVSSLSLTVTNSLQKRLSAITEPFLALEDLTLLSQNGMWWTAPTFLWGPGLRSLHLTRVFIPTFFLLHSLPNLVDLHLHEVDNPQHFSPEVLTHALSKLAQLRLLSPHFLPTDDSFSLPPPSVERVSLPFLASLNYRGTTGYLKALVARIDAPRLGDIEVAFVKGSITDLSELTGFIDRTEMHKSHSRADILSSEHAVSISWTTPGAPTCLKLQLFGGPQLSSFMAQIYTQFSSVKWLQVSGNLSKDIVCTLQPPDRRPESVLPTLWKLHILQPEPHFVSLKEAVVSFMTPRRLSGHPIAVEYERLRHISELPGTEPFSSQVTIESLSEDILLNIFRHSMSTSPRIWQTLQGVCQRWREIVLTSPLGLNLRLYCTYGKPVLNSLDCWPALPIIVQYGGLPNLDPPASQDDDHIIAALKQSGRVSSISLTVTSSLLEKLSTISEPLTGLKDLTLLSRDDMQLTLPGTFRWGSLLRTLHSTKIAFPFLSLLLSPCKDLVDIQLHEIPRAGYFPPESFANALSGMTQLKILSLYFLSLPSRGSYLYLPLQSGKRTALPALRCLRYRGTSKYLDSFVARIDAPRLDDIDITFFYQPSMDASQLGRFIERIDMQTSLIQADVENTALAISLSCTNASTSTLFRLQILCRQLDWQLSCIAQVCDQISPFLSCVNNLGLNVGQPPGGQDDDVDSGQWLDLVRSFKFGRAKSFWVTGELTTYILSALRPVDDGRSTTVLPALRHLRVQKPLTMNGRSWDAIQSFITSRSISGRPVEVNAPSYQCHICRGSSEDQKELKCHLRDKYGYQILCSYCGVFECTPRRSGLFRGHIKSAHPKVACKDELISKTSLNPAQLDSIINRHSFLRAPDIVPPSPMDAAPYSPILSPTDAAPCSPIISPTDAAPYSPVLSPTDVVPYSPIFSPTYMAPSSASLPWSEAPYSSMLSDSPTGTTSISSPTGMTPYSPILTPTLCEIRSHEA